LLFLKLLFSEKASDEVLLRRVLLGEHDLEEVFGDCGGDGGGGGRAVRRQPLTEKEFFLCKLLVWQFCREVKVIDWDTKMRLLEIIEKVRPYACADNECLRVLRDQNLLDATVYRVNGIPLLKQRLRIA
jgi:hypothetical protein